MSILSRKSTPAIKLPIPKLDPATVQPLSKLTAEDKNFLERSEVLAVSQPRGTAAEYATSVPSAGGAVEKQLDTIARTINSAHRSAVKSVLRIGQGLLEAQALLAKHGNGGMFETWYKSRVKLSRQAVYNYLSVARSFAGCTSLGQFTLEALYLLARKTSPPAAVAEALTVADDRKRVTLVVAKKIIRQHTVVSTPAQKVPSTKTYTCGVGSVVVKHTDGVTPEQVLLAVIRQLKELRDKKAA